MTSCSGRRFRRPGTRSCRVALIILSVAIAAAGPAAAASPHKRHAKSPARHAMAAKVARTHNDGPAQADARAVSETDGELSFSDEFDRAELVERMLSECRGIAFNAYELAQASGEALQLPAPIQLMTVRVLHPYCADLLRTYAPKTRV